MRGVEAVVLGDDSHARRVAAALGERGAAVALLDLAPFPGLLPLEIEDGVPRWQGEDLGGARAVYVRSVHMRLPFFELDLAARRGVAPGALVEEWRRGYAAERERQSFLSGFLLAFERRGARVVNPAATLDQHFVKLDQLAILRAAGLPVPRTLATNDPGAVRRFASALGGRVVEKPLAGGDLCRRLDPATLDAGALLPPRLFQEEAPGRDVRVFVAGGRAIATYEIESDDVDFRAGAKAVRRRTAPLPCVEAACVRAAAACGMAFTGVDVKVEGQGASEERFAILECNPSPMFEAFERTVPGETPVTDALCDLLLG